MYAPLNLETYLQVRDSALGHRPSVNTKENAMVDSIPYEDEKERALHLGAIHDLAQASGLPEGEVGKIYQREFEKLKKSARVKDFLPVLTHRLVKNNLRHHS